MIGVFDSGSGGLTVLEALHTLAPRADIVYFGDIKNAPYGERPKEELARLVREGIQILQAHGADEIVSACNSVSISVLEGMVGHDRIIEMSRPTARMMRAHAGSRVLLLATDATIRSGMYREALRPIVSLDELPIPGLAYAIESEASHGTLVSLVKEALASKVQEKYDTVLLGCTHYPLIRSEIEEAVQTRWGAIPCIDPAHAVAQEAARRFNVEGDGTLTFLISKESHGFRNRIAPYFLETQCSLKIV